MHARFLLSLFLLGGFEDRGDGLVEGRIPFLVGHLVVEAFSKGSRKGGDHAVLLDEDGVGFIPRVSTRKGNHSDAVGVVDKILVEVDFGGERKLDHDGSSTGDLVAESIHKLFLEDGFDLGLVGAGNVNLGFEDGDQSGIQDLVADLELLVNDRLDSFLVELLDDGSHLGSENSLVLCALQQITEGRHGLHELNTVLERRKSLVALEERNDLLLLPKVGGGGNSLDITVHCVLEENGTECAVSLEGGSGDDAGSDLVDDVVHGSFSQDVLVFFDSEGLQGLGSGSTRLVKSCEVSIEGLGTFQLFGKGSVAHFVV
mmetsp:Transcript_16380/g.37910  ORF Transcript_16380/g.37910 Transcript_16380/m.37910 type:complete len:315 (-) Transcript_16380:65-1009(-)